MIDLQKITIAEFKKKFYKRYIKLFPQDEQRDWPKIEDTYNKGIEQIYKIMLDSEPIGFMLLEKVENHPYYGDYFAIFEEYQNKGYGTLAFQKVLQLCEKEGFCGEIEMVDQNNIVTKRRWKFYERLGFKKGDSLYKLFNVFYEPIIYSSYNYSKEQLDQIMFDYYLVNSGSKEIVDKNCEIIEK